MKRIFTSLVLTLAFILSLSSQENKPTLAILDVVPVNVEESQSAIVQNYILDQVHRSGTYSVVERSELEAAFAEMELALSGAVDEATAAQVGKMAGAEFILLSSLAYSEGRYHISMRVVSVASSRIVDTAVKSDASFSRVEKLVKEAVTQLLRSGLQKAPVTTFAGLDAHFSLGFPLGTIADILTLACIPSLEGRYNVSFPWGILSAGLSVGGVITSTKDTTLTAYSLYTIPVGVSLGYATNFASSFFMSLHVTPGAAFIFLVYPASETGTVPRTFTAASFALLAEVRAGFDLNNDLSLYLRGGFTYIQFSADDYLAVSPGIGATVKL